jgi:hypothetical protein
MEFIWLVEEFDINLKATISGSNVSAYKSWHDAEAHFADGSQFEFISDTALVIGTKGQYVGWVTKKQVN